MKIPYTIITLMRSLIVSAIVVITSLVTVSMPAPVLALEGPQYRLTAATGDAPDILVSPVQGPSLTRELTNRAATSWPWYITRAAGLLAAVSLVLLLLSGIGLITGATFKLLEPLTAWATHRAIGIVFAVSATIHVVALLFDTYVPFTIAQVLFPFVSNYRTVTVWGVHLGSFYVALGIFALYGAVAIILSSLFWIDKKPYIWKLIHFLSYLVMTFVFIHALYLGTDLAKGIFRTLWIIFGIIVAVAIVIRLERRRSP